MINRLPEAPRLGVAGATVDQRDELRDIEIGDPLEVLSHCRICSGRHPTICPYLRVVEYHPSGQVARMVIEPREDLKRAIVYEGEPDPLELLRQVLAAVEGAKTLRSVKSMAGRVMAELEPPA